MEWQFLNVAWLVRKHWRKDTPKEGIAYIERSGERVGRETSPFLDTM